MLDTNVLVSAFLSPHGPPARLLDLVLEGRVLLLWDDRILAEYIEVLERPAFGFDAEDVRTVIYEVRRQGEQVIAAPLALDLPDPDDLPFLEVAATGRADVLVTGNARHYRPKRGKAPAAVVSPAEALRLLANEGK